MARIIEAKAVLSGSETLSPLLDRVAKKMKEVAAAGKQSVAVDKMAASMAKVAAQVKAMEKFNAAKMGFVNARKNFHETEVAVDRAALAMKNAEGPAKQLAADYRRTQSAVAAASRAMDQQRNAVLGAKNALDRVGGSIGNAVSAQHRLAQAVDRTNAAMRRQANWAARRREMGVLGSYAGMALGYATVRGAHATLHTYREFDKERRFGKAVMGITDTQQSPLISQAIHLGATTKYNDIQVLEAQRMSAARGMNIGQVMGLIEPATNLGQALDLRLPDATKQMEAALFGYKRDISTPQAARASAIRTADMQVKAAKISGMTPEDLTALYKYGANPGRMAGMSEENLLAFGGILKKANMGGDESGVAYRALMSNANSPTRKAKEAMLANGMNFKNYQKNPDSLALKPFLQNVAAQYGVKVSNKTAAGLGAIFSNKKLIADPAAFTPAVMKFLKHELHGNNAKSLRSIAGAANRYRDASMKGVNTDKFVEDLMRHLSGNLNFANSMFGPKQGGRIATALTDPETFKKIKDQILNHSEGYAGNISAERMAGFDGAVSRLEGALKNVETAIGRSIDAGGEGGPLTQVTNWAGQLVQSFAQLNPQVIEVTSGMLLIGGALAGLKGLVNISSLLFGEGGLKASAAALDTSAGLLSKAAGELMLGAPKIPGAPGAPGVVPVGTPGAPGAPSGGPQKPSFFSPAWQYAIYEGGKAAMDWGFGVLPHPAWPKGYDPDAELDKSPWTRAKQIWGELPFTGGGTGRTPGLPVQAELTGHATVSGKAEITIYIPGMGLQKAFVPMDGTLNANGPGSLGTSSPDAAAHRGGIGHN